MLRRIHPELTAHSAKRLSRHRIELVRPRELPAEVPLCRGNLEELLARGVAIPRPSYTPHYGIGWLKKPVTRFLLEPLIG